MMRFPLIKPLLVTAVLFTGAAQAAPDARQVLAASPVDDIVAQYPAMMRQGIRDGLKQTGQLPPMVVDAIGNVMSSSVSAAEIERRIIIDLQNQLTDAQLEAVQNWYETPLAQKISAAEIAASAPSAWGKIQARAPELSRKYQGTRKAEMFDRFDRAARATESAVDTTIAMQLGLAKAMAAFSGGSANDGQLRQRIESQRDMLRGAVSKQVYHGYLHTYEDIGVQEMDLYLGFLESPAGAAFSKVVANSLQRAMTDPITSNPWTLGS